MNRDRLFLGSCFSLISTSVCFAVIGAIMGPLKAQFALSNEEVGYIGGAAIWGFTISIFVLGPLVDADLYPDEKTKKLNQFHVWFPGGIVLGAVASHLLDQFGLPDWRIKVGLIIVPTVIYGILFAGQAFPVTERVQSGVSFGGMVRGALLRPLFLILLACMCITASLELGPGRWVPAVLAAGGIAGILVLAYINGLMAILRFFAGPVVDRLSPTGILVASAVLAGSGLYWFSFAESTAMAFASATVFAVGICYFWPTMLGVVSERVPRSGALGLALMGGMGMLVVGLVTAPQMGRIADGYMHGQLNPQQARVLLQRVVDVYPAAAADKAQAIQDEVVFAVDSARDVIGETELPEGDTADALRTAVASNPGGDTADELAHEIQMFINPPDNYGGRMSFRYVAPWSLVIIIVFGVLYIRDRAKGGYQVETIGEP